MVKKILCVEDNPMNIELIEDLFRAKGYEVDSIGRGDEVLDVMKKSKPDLVLLDMQLPGMDGYMVARWLKSEDSTKDVPIIAVTAYASLYSREKAINAGCNEYMGKPIDTHKLVEMVKDFIGTANG